MDGSSFQTDVPARMDRLPWARFHTLIVAALGITWILDGLEVTLVGAISGVLQERATLGLTPEEIGLIASFYVTGAVLGSLVFGYLTDRWGRKKLFFITLAIYLTGVILTAFSWNFWSFCVFRFLTGAGIGGEYSAINSAIDELIPARVRGRVDLMINGSYWAGAAVGSLSTLILLDPKYFSADVGWRVAFGLGGIVGLGILWLRKYVPESPRWLVIHKGASHAEEILGRLEKEIEAETGKKLSPVETALTVHPRGPIGFGQIFHTMFTLYRRRSLLGLTLMTSQAFMYNAIFFTYALILTKFYEIPATDTGLYLLPFALGNLVGPFALGHFFDTLGRRKMISFTYAISGILLAVTGYLFGYGYISAVEQTALWTVIFFFGSAAASSAYLTVSEIFPLETRGMAIALFFSIGTGTGGIVAPWLFGSLIGTGDRLSIYYGYLAVAGLMLFSALVEWLIGIDAERTSLEEIAPPLSG